MNLATVQMCDAEIVPLYDFSKPAIQLFLSCLYVTIPAVTGLCKSFLRVSSALTILAAYTINGARSPRLMNDFDQ